MLHEMIRKDKALQLCCDIVALCCAKNRHCESSLVMVAMRTTKKQKGLF